LSLFAELQYLAANEADVSHTELLKLGTYSGRVALTGSSGLDVADLCVVGWGPGVSCDPERQLFASGNRILATMVAGQWRFVSPDFQVKNDLA
jgi:hypothetical protein